jgi:hypothetical protein
MADSADTDENEMSIEIMEKTDNVWRNIEEGMVSASKQLPRRVRDPGTAMVVHAEQSKINRIAQRKHYRIQKRRYKILDKIRINCVNLTAYHNHRYHLYKNMLFSFFRVPLIILNSVNSFIAIGLQSHIGQENVSLINAVVSLFCGILTSIELLLNLQKRMELEIECAKEYYKIGVDIYTELCREPEDRGESGNLEKFLREKHNQYQTLYAKSNAVNLSERDFVDEFELFIIQEDDESTFIPDTDSRSEDNFCERERENSIYNPNSRPASTGHNQPEYKPTSWCPECLVNTMTSGFAMMLYCCTGTHKPMRSSGGSENAQDLVTFKSLDQIDPRKKYTFHNHNHYDERFGRMESADHMRNCSVDMAIRKKKTFLGDLGLARNV